MSPVARESLRVGIVGVAGRMGRCFVQTVLDSSDMDLIMAVGGQSNIGDDVTVLADWPDETGIKITNNLKVALESSKPDVVVELSTANTVYENTQTILSSGIPVVVGASGLSDADVDELRGLVQQHNTGMLLAPNFSLGAILMMRFAKEAAKYYESAEIIERHHEKKLDAPSGTALRTAAMMQEARNEFKSYGLDSCDVQGCARGTIAIGQIPIHSLRLPGSLAHQEVLFGATGETLTLRHDTQDRQAFMAGITLAVKEIAKRKGVYIGLETVM